MSVSEPCDCESDGYCSRYRRQMTGRFRDICRGIDVDLGAATAFREQWLREAQQGSNLDLCDFKRGPRALLLKNSQMPGDVLVLTAAIYSLHRTYPGKYVTAVETLYPSIFEYNPDVVAAALVPEATPIEMHYPAVHRCNDRGIHFMQGFCEFLGMALEVPVPLATNRPRLYFLEPPPPVEDFWVICSGGKRDLTNKLWGINNYQEVVTRLHGEVRFVQVGSSDDDHPHLIGVHKQMVGETDLRQLFDLVRRARGVLCGVSLLMHVAAALEKPAIVVAGGREPVQWNAYPRQQYVHTVGALPCRSVQGHVGQACWRSRILPTCDGTWYDRDTCERPVDGLPECMRMITPAEVARLVEKYNSFN